MNKRYMDFVPAKKDIPKGGIVVKKPVKKSAKPVRKVVKKVPAANPLLDEEIVVEEIFAEKEEPAGVTKGSTKLNTKADLHPNFVKANVKKRPLGAKNPVAAKPVKPAATVAKTTGAIKPAKKSAVASGVVTTAKRPAPLGQRAKFINTNKIEKRPLSSVGARKTPVIVPKLIEKKKAPEKIISKPEKDSKAGLIIAIILTIILGAAAGTVAFLLLPK
jgi:hypothetical protein